MIHLLNYAHTRKWTGVCVTSVHGFICGVVLICRACGASTRAYQGLHPANLDIFKHVSLLQG